MAKVKFTPAPLNATEQAALEEDFQAAREYGTVWLGERYLFYPAPLRLRYLALADICQAYLRREQTLVPTGCRRTLTPLPFLVAVLSGGEQKKISLTEDDPVRELLAALPERNAAIRIGYSEDGEQ